MRVVLLAPLLLLVAACGSGQDTVSAQPTGSATSLTVEHRADADAEPQRWTLTCGPAGGDHPQAEQACRVLESLEEPFKPVPADAICTEQYGGPQTATVRGTYRGRPVELELSRENGCSISQWDRLVPLVPAAS